VPYSTSTSTVIVEVPSGAVTRYWYCTTTVRCNIEEGFAVPGTGTCTGIYALVQQIIEIAPVR
jgi:hypothetical protein